jgi:hypothetical protein
MFIRPQMPFFRFSLYTRETPAPLPPGQPAEPDERAKVAASDLGAGHIMTTIIIQDGIRMEAAPVKLAARTNGASRAKNTFRYARICRFH